MVFEVYAISIDKESPYQSGQQRRARTREAVFNTLTTG